MKKLKELVPYLLYVAGSAALLAGYLTAGSLLFLAGTLISIIYIILRRDCVQVPC